MLCAHPYRQMPGWVISGDVDRLYRTIQCNLNKRTRTGAAGWGQPWATSRRTGIGYS
jgi:hypothetical protein